MKFQSPSADLVLILVLGGVILYSGHKVYSSRKQLHADPNAPRESVFGEGWILLVGLILSLAGLVLLLHYEPKDLFWKVAYAGVTELGFAFVIAWAVGNLVEKKARREYNEFVEARTQALGQNVLYSLYDIRIPKETYKIIEDYIFKRPVIKIRQRIEWTIPDPSPNSDWILIKCIFDYDLKNVSDKRVKDYRVRFHISAPTVADHPADGDAGTKLVRIRNDVFDEEQIRTMNKAEADADGQVRYSHPISIGPDEVVPVRIVFFQHKRVKDADIFKHSCLCERTELTVRYNSAIYDFFAEPISPCEAFDSVFKNADHTGRYEALMTKPMLPKNGIYMWWDKKPATISEPGAGAPTSVAVQESPR
jgi:hypothetical protein